MPADPTPPLRLAVLGYGHVGSALADAWLRAGHAVVLADSSHRPGGAAAARDADPRLAGAQVAPAAEAVAHSDAALVALPAAAVAPTLAPLAGVLEDRVVVDATNPVSPGLRHATGPHRSGADVVREAAAGARVVKAFNTYGHEVLRDPSFAARPLLPYAADDADAGRLVAALASGSGWDPLHVGGLDAAVDLEHLALLWIRLVRGQGAPARTVWQVAT